MVTTSYAYNCEHFVEDVLAKASMGLAVVYHHLLHDFLGGDAAKAT